MDKPGNEGNKMITKTITITTDSTMMKRIERFLALLHYNSCFGHSGLFGMYLDGDGWEKVKVEGLDRRLALEVDAIGGVGYDIEIAQDNSYIGKFTQRNIEHKWYTGPAANLYKDGCVVKTIPGRDYDYKDAVFNKPKIAPIEEQRREEV
jgi:hypothetical protein